MLHILKFYFHLEWNGAYTITPMSRWADTVSPSWGTTPSLLALIMHSRYSKWFGYIEFDFKWLNLRWRIGKMIRNELITVFKTAILNNLINFKCTTFETLSRYIRHSWLPYNKKKEVQVCIAFMYAQRTAYNSFPSQSGGGGIDERKFPSPTGFPCTGEPVNHHSLPTAIKSTYLLFTCAHIL